MRQISLIALTLLAGCGSRPPGAAMLTKAQLATVERAVLSCTAATGAVAPLVARGPRLDLENAAVDARNRCSGARGEIVKAVGGDRDLAVCARDVQAQEKVAVAQLGVVDAPSSESRAALVKALDEAVTLQTECGRVVARLQGQPAPV